ncbi:cupin domain-containing protein [Sediminicoccus sp. KRV36]|uniref:cupin domain-containing protein n=1 Tax=Sediminicoccus sp. KRV36 TaxID=3133721 RepID=UPI00200E0D34|nr:cupin domain-containing protein [Sediminicoccus rosea]UPY35294.1 cupin domain-containing protein [Sediminicoccus rosea]
MTPTEFEAALLRDGFSAETRAIEPDRVTPEHSHPFDVRALVLEGEITLSSAGGSRTYRPGEVFTMAAGCPHAEAVGPTGVRNLVGRRHQAPAG